MKAVLIKKERVDDWDSGYCVQKDLWSYGVDRSHLEWQEVLFAEWEGLEEKIIERI